MTGRIYVLGGADQLEPLEEAAYEAESVLQQLLASYPDLLAGEQVDPNDPRRWLLVRREMSVAEEEGGAGRWSLDHLFIDQQGVPTLVEVKRSSNTQIRREVVGQMLDYAANGSAYWAVEELRAVYERRCQAEGLDPEVHLAEFLGDDSDTLNFWDQVKTNLQAGRIRMVFVADEISRELRRIIEFLNSQLDPAEVLGLEVRQYQGQGRTALVPRVVGWTVAAEAAKSPRRPTEWDQPSFLAYLQEQRGEAEAAVGERILSWIHDRHLHVKWGRGMRNGSASPKSIRDGIVYNMLTLWTDGSLQIQFGSMNEGPFSSHSMRREFAERLVHAHESFQFADDQLVSSWPVVRLRSLIDSAVLERFLAAWDWYLGVLSE